MSALLSTVAAVILAVLKALPALEGLVTAALAERARAREAEALARKREKDAAVDKWLASGNEREPSP